MNIKRILGYVPLIIGDGGHGNNTPGKRTPEFSDGTVIKEYQFNKPTAKYFLEKATEMGFDTLNVSPEKWDVPLKIRTNRANKAYQKQLQKYPNAPKDKLAIFVSFHYNAQDSKWGGTRGGVEVYYYPLAKDAEKLAGNILNYLIQGTSQFNRGIKTADFHVLRETVMTAVLIEAGFMDYKEEAKKMLDESFQKEVATEALKGCCEYLDVILKDKNPEIIKLKNEITKLKYQIENLKEENNKIKIGIEEVLKEYKDIEDILIKL